MQYVYIVRCEASCKNVCTKMFVDVFYMYSMSVTCTSNVYLYMLLSMNIILITKKLQTLMYDIIIIGTIIAVNTIILLLERI